MADSMFGNDRWEGIATLGIDEIKEYLVPGYKEGSEYGSSYFSFLGERVVGRVLDFGCGIGRNFPGLLPPMLESCRKYTQPSSEVWLTSNWQEVLSQRYDITMATFVFQHIDSSASCQELLKTLSTKSTYLYVTSRKWADGDHRSVYRDILDSGSWRQFCLRRGCP